MGGKNNADAVLDQQQGRNMLGAAESAQRPGGASIIELMVIVALVGIVAMLGLPSFTAFIADTRIRTAAEGVLSGMQLARTEAVRRNRDIEFVLSSPGTSGGTGWSVAQLDGTVIQSRPDGEGSAGATFAVTPAAATRLTFSGFGRTTANSDKSVPLTQIDVGSAGGRALRITLIDGQPRLCDPAIKSDGDPRKC